MNLLVGQSRVVLVSVFCILFAITLTVGLATQWTFDLFQPQFLWKAYNHYFLSMLDGRLDLPVEAIGKEGGYFNSKAYMYYGLLPVIVRAILYPFVDLTQTPVSYFSVLFFTLIGHVALQVSLINVYLKNKSADRHQLSYWMLIAVSCILWFGSASFMISQNATLYHEPYAVSLCLANIYLALLLKDGFFLQQHQSISLLPYALLAGLCIHGRMPTALTLYLVTGILILVQTVRIRKSAGLNIGPFSVVMQSMRSFWPALLIMGAFGLSILWLNYAKYGNPLAFMGGNYGYFFLEGFSDRRCNIVPTSEFSNILRIIPNLAVYLTASTDLHWSLTWHLATGFGRLEIPLVPLILLWPLPIFCFLYLLVNLLKGLKNTTNRILLLGLLLFSVGAFFQLKYATITHRYSAELWLPLWISLLFLWFKLMNNPSKSLLTHRFFQVNFLAVAVLLFTGIGYQLYLATTNEYYLQDGPLIVHQDFHYLAEDNQFLATLTPEKINQFKADYKQQKEQKCAELADKRGLTELLDKKNAN
jgi:hypothetical protein